MPLAINYFTVVFMSFCLFLFFFQDEYNLNPGLEWEDEFTGRYISKCSQAFFFFEFVIKLGSFKNIIF